MGANSAISWTHHTFNPWWGCTRVSPGCQHCYAEAFAKRTGTGWGPSAERRFFGRKHWNEPLRWEREAEEAGERRRVFCASMADVFEDRPELASPRRALFEMIEQQTPHLDWLLLTKRPENILRTVPSGWRKGFPGNVWAGTTAEDQAHYDLRWQRLRQIPAVVRFISYEPALGPLDLRVPGVFNADIPAGFGLWSPERQHEAIATAARALLIARDELPEWVIGGGESGPRRRPCEVSWFDDLARQCSAAGIPFFMKQDSGQYPGKQGRLPDALWNEKRFPEVADA